MQATILPSKPMRHKVEPIKNPPTLHENADIKVWIKSGQYRHNKPFGGLWTSTQLSGEHVSDWHVALIKHPHLRMQFDAEALYAYCLAEKPETRILSIGSWTEALAFTERYRLGLLPEIAGFGPPVLTREITDWERALQDYEAIRLTENGADEVAHRMITDRADSAFTGWYCESTLYAGWSFSTVESVGRVAIREEKT